MAFLLVAATTYFAMSCTLTLELGADEGQLIYPIWRVAMGAIPYADFYQLYGPSLFLLNGNLLRYFGDDLLVTRVSLVLLKAALAVVVYLSARRLASWPFALGVYGLFLAIWGAPMWLFNTPYAHHYSMVASMAGLLVFLALARHRLAAGFVAGLCFGVAATFKQTAAVFGFTSFVLFLLWITPPAAPGAVSPTGRWWSLDLLARTARGTVLLGSLVLCIAYLWRANSAWNVFLLVTPLAVAAGAVGARELWGRLDPAARGRSLMVLALCAGGTVLPIALYAVSYARRGQLSALAANLVGSIPQVIKCFWPIPALDVRTAASALLVLLTLATTGLWRVSAGHPGTRRRVAAAVSGVALLALLAFSARAAVREAGLYRFLRSGAWQGDILRLYFFLPFLTVWASLHAVAGTRRDQPSPGTSGASAPREEEALVLFTAFATTGLLYLYPAGDFWHVMMALPAFLPLLAYQLERFHRLDDSLGMAPVGRLASGTVIAVLLIVLAVPPVLSLVTTRLNRPATSWTFARASGISSSRPNFAAAAALVGHLVAEQPAERKLFVVANEPMLYFLAGRVSAMDKEAFLLSLLGADMIGDRDVRALLPPSLIIERLQAERPLVVDRVDDPGSQRFRTVYPEVAAYIDEHYQSTTTFGKYRLLEGRIAAEPGRQEGG